MTKTLWIWILAIGVLAQQPDYQHGLIILDDGRMVSMRGEYEIIGEEVHFMDGRGELMVLPLDRVDIQATDQRNKEIREKAKGDGIVDDGSLYSKVEKYKKQKGQKKELTNEDLRPKVEIQPPQEVQEETGYLDKLNEIGSINPEMVEEWTQKIESKMQATPYLLTIVIVAAILMLILGLTTLITQIYLIVISFREGFIWWFSLLATFAGPFILNVFGAIMGASNLLYTLIPQVLQFLSLIAFPAFIIVCCPGRRFKLLMFWGLFYVFSIGMGILFFFWILAG